MSISLVHERWAGDAASGTASSRTRHCEGGIWTLSAVPLLWPSRVLGHSSALQVPRAPGSSLILAMTFRIHPWGASTPLQPGLLAKVKSCGLSAVDGTGWVCSGSRNRDWQPFLPCKQTHRGVERHRVRLAAGPPLRAGQH